MRTPATDRANGGLAAAAKEVAEHARSLARLEVELAKLELKKKLRALGLGIGLLVGAAVFALFALGFLLATLAAALATAVATWLALLITAAILFAITAGLGLGGVRLLARGTPPVPEQAIREAKRTTEAIKSDAVD